MRSPKIQIAAIMLFLSLLMEGNALAQQAAPPKTESPPPACTNIPGSPPGPGAIQQRKLVTLTTQQAVAKVNELSATKKRFMMVFTDGTDQSKRPCDRRSVRLEAVETSHTMFEIPVFHVDMTSPRARELFQELVLEDAEEGFASLKLGGVVILSWDAAGRLGRPHILSEGIGLRIQVDLYNACLNENVKHPGAPINVKVSSVTNPADPTSVAARTGPEPSNGNSPTGSLASASTDGTKQ